MMIHKSRAPLHALPFPVHCDLAITTPVIVLSSFSLERTGTKSRIMSYAADNKQVRESIDSNLEVKTGSSSQKHFDGQNNEEIRNAVEVMSNHLKSSSQLIHFKNLDNIINAAIVLLSKQTGEIEPTRKIIMI